MVAQMQIMLVLCWPDQPADNGTPQFVAATFEQVAPTTSKALVLASGRKLPSAMPDETFRAAHPP
jgi:hypothetical protein